MLSPIDLAQLVSGISFMGYGTSCLLSTKMEQEFTRYGLSRFRILTGSLQVAGSLGLLAGYFLPYLTLMSSLGLATLMFLGILVRLRIHDPFFASLPAFFFCVLNSMIFFSTLP